MKTIFISLLFLSSLSVQANEVKDWVDSKVNLNSCGRVLSKMFNYVSPTNKELSLRLSYLTYGYKDIQQQAIYYSGIKSQFRPDFNASLSTIPQDIAYNIEFSVRGSIEKPIIEANYYNQFHKSKKIKIDSNDEELIKRDISLSKLFQDLEEPTKEYVDRNSYILNVLADIAKEKLKSQKAKAYESFLNANKKAFGISKVDFIGSDKNNKSLVYLLDYGTNTDGTRLFGVLKVSDERIDIYIGNKPKEFDEIRGIKRIGYTHPHFNMLANGVTIGDSISASFLGNLGFNAESFRYNTLLERAEYSGSSSSIYETLKELNVNLNE